MNLNEISFSHNWNKKLGCKAFTTIRLYNPKKYQIGKIYNVYYNKAIIYEAEIIDIKPVVLATLNEMVCYLDTGYSMHETKEILKKMYPFLKDKPNTVFSIILLKQLKN